LERPSRVPSKEAYGGVWAHKRVFPTVCPQNWGVSQKLWVSKQTVIFFVVDWSFNLVKFGGVLLFLLSH